jgi:hypothetical protein
MTGERSKLFKEALTHARQLASIQPDLLPIQSVIRQLDYLLAVCEGKTPASRLPDINIGLIAAREIEGLDDHLANRLHQCSAKVRKMDAENKKI